MKNVLMIFLMLGGLAMTTAEAQSCCILCPPECCIAMGCAPGQRGASAVNNQAGDAKAMAMCASAASEGMCQGKKMSKKELKACIAACEAMRASASQDQSHVAPVSGNKKSAACCATQKTSTSSASIQSEPSPTPVAAKL